MDEKSIYFITDNLVLASVLKGEGFPIVGINKKNPRHSYFEFLQSDELVEVVKQYWSDTLLTSPKRFASSMKDLKTMLYDHSYETGNYQPKGEVPPDDNPDKYPNEERRSSEDHAS